MSIEMAITNLNIDPVSKTPFLLLQDKEKKYTVSIWIGVFEASAIASHLEGMKVSRPMTHDLLANTFGIFEAKLVKIEIVDIKENTYFANLVVQRTTGEEVVMDARPSDAIALALRLNAPIFVSETVIEKTNASQNLKGEKPKIPEEEKWEEILKNLSPEAFGKYKM